MRRVESVGHESLLPEPRRSGAPYRIDLVCLGNICRSPMADVILTEQLARRRGAGPDVEVVSSGTGDWHAGNPMDRRAAALLTAHGYDAKLHRAQQFESSWLAGSDLVLAMDEDNLADLRSFPDVDDGRVRLFRDFDPHAQDGDRSVPDPYYGGDDGFEAVLAIIERTCAHLVELLSRRRASG